MSQPTIQDALKEAHGTIAQLARLAGGETTTPEQLEKQTLLVQEKMAALHHFNKPELEPYGEALSKLRADLDQAIHKINTYKETLKKEIQTNAIRAKANKGYGGK